MVENGVEILGGQIMVGLRVLAWRWIFPIHSRRSKRGVM